MSSLRDKKMPAYIAEPAQQPFPPVTIPCVVPSNPNYSFGRQSGYADFGIEAEITNFSITGNVVTFSITPGVFAASFSAGASVVVTEAPAPYTYLNTTYTVSTASQTQFTAPLTHADVASTPVDGDAVQPGVIGQEFGEALPTTATAGRQFAVRAFAGLNQNSPAIDWEISYGGTVSAVNIVLQGALIDEDADYFTLDTSTNTAGENRTVNLGSTRVNFLRIKVVSSTNTNGTVVAKFVL
jgi:hypothetical protein